MQQPRYEPAINFDIRKPPFMPDNKTTQKIEIIAFDFDGTITTTDTLAIFFRYYAGNVGWFFKILKLLPVFIGYGIKIVPRDSVKAHLVKTFLTGEDAEEFQERADQFAKEIIPGLIRPAAQEALNAKKQSPHTLYIVSASLSAYLIPWARSQGIDNVIATNVHVLNGKLTGELDGPNCWGPGKISKIDGRLGKNAYKIVEAYGDTRGDREMLHAAEASFFKPFRV